jgi:hypothetical protein
MPRVYARGNNNAFSFNGTARCRLTNERFFLRAMMPLRIREGEPLRGNAI